jgi:hypothetical protein
MGPGFPGGGMGALGARGGFGAMGGMGARGGPPGGGATGLPPSGGNIGRPGGGGAIGFGGGPPGQPGGPGPGGMIGGGPGPGGSLGDIAEVDPESLPYLVKVVVEVSDRSRSEKQKLDYYGIPIKIHHKWGDSLVANVRGSPIHVTFLVYPPVAKRFEKRKAEVFKDGKPSTDQVLELAEWALQHGMLPTFTQMMDKLVQEDKSHPAVAAYAKVRAELEREVKNDDAAVNLRAKLGDNFKATPSKYYTVLHDSPTADAVEIKAHLDRLDDNLRAFYYWFALKKTALPMPQERLVVLLVHDKKKFDEYHDNLTSGPVVADGFFARRENLAVFSANRTDEHYQAVTTATKPLWDQQGFRRDALLVGKTGVGYPATAPLPKIAEAATYALLLKAMEAESERASISHDASRQLVFAAGLLPRNVAAPEWVLYGAGSFFETPLGAPWPTTGAPSGEHLPIFKHLKDAKKGDKLDKPYDTLVQVVTDGYFRQTALTGEKHLGQRKARATAWALTYFLVQKRLDGLQRYYAELRKMPRDIDLDADVLLTSFARAFDALDKDGKPDRAKLTKLADQWFNFIDNTPLEEEEILNQVKKNLSEMKTQPGTDPKQPPPPGGPGG